MRDVRVGISQDSQSLGGPVLAMRELFGGLHPGVG